jgi:hypothetical protein
VPGSDVTGESILPPESKQKGKNLAEWMLRYWTWLLGGDQEQTVGNVLFMPLPNATPTDVPGVLEGSCEVTMRPGTAFALPVIANVGEAYDEGAPDNPNAPPYNEFAGGLTANVTLDGKTLIDTVSQGIGKYYYGPVYFDSPIEYAEPQPRDGRNAVAVIWAEGIGFLHGPLKVGTHTMELHSSSSHFGVTFNNTWTITVSPDAEVDLSCDGD